MSVYDVVVGDILFLEPGEIIPVDGLFLEGHNVQCDESGATGESDAVKKCSYEELINGGSQKHRDCFLLSGAKVLEGVGTYVVTGVGESSFNGRIMMCEYLLIRHTSSAHVLIRLIYQHCVETARRHRYSSN